MTSLVTKYFSALSFHFTYLMQQKHEFAHFFMGNMGIIKLSANDPDFNVKKGLPFFLT